MPNRKTFDEREKLDHSSHSLTRREKGDQTATPATSDSSSEEENARRSGEPGTGQTRDSR